MTDPVAAAFRLAWAGTDPGPTDHRRRPAEAWRAARPVPLPTAGPGPGGLLALSLATDPARVQGGVRLRRVPSAGGRYPVDARVGGHAYDPVAHALATTGESPLPTGVPDIRLTLSPARTLWRYGPRSLPVLLLDLGHASGALLAAGAALGIPLHARLEPGPDGPSVLVSHGSRTSQSPRPGADPGPAVDPVLLALARWRGPAVELGRSGPPRAPSVLTGRRSASWTELTADGPAPDPDALLAIARTRLGTGQRAEVLQRDTAAPLLGRLADRSCGQPDVARVAALIIVTGDVDAGPDTTAQHVRAGLALHEAWLAATAAGIPVRPVGCWIETVLTGPNGRSRLVHALAVGPGTRGPAEHVPPVPAQAR